MGRFTADVAYKTAGNVVQVRGVAAVNCTGTGTPADRPDMTTRLTKEISIELPASADPDRIRVDYIGGVVTVHAPVVRVRRPRPMPTHWSPSSRSPTTASRSPRAAGNFSPSLSPRDGSHPSVSPIYSLQQKLLSSSTAASAAV